MYIHHGTCVCMEGHTLACARLGPPRLHYTACQNQLKQANCVCPHHLYQPSKESHCSVPPTLVPRVLNLLMPSCVLCIQKQHRLGALCCIEQGCTHPSVGSFPDCLLAIVQAQLARGWPAVSYPVVMAAPGCRRNRPLLGLFLLQPGSSEGTRLHEWKPKVARI